MKCRRRTKLFLTAQLIMIERGIIMPFLKENEIFD